MPTSNLLIKAAAILAFILAIVGTTWFASKAHYVNQFDALKAEIQQQAKDEQKTNDAIDVKNNYITKEAYAEAQTQLANAGNTINDLNSRLSNSPGVITSHLSSSQSCTNKLDAVSNGPGVDTGKGQSTKVEGSVASISSMDTEVMRDVLQTGIDALNAELIWRGWNRGDAK